MKGCLPFRDTYLVVFAYVCLELTQNIRTFYMCCPCYGTGSSDAEHHWAAAVDSGVGQ